MNINKNITYLDRLKLSIKRYSTRNGILFAAVDNQNLSNKMEKELLESQPLFNYYNHAKEDGKIDISNILKYIDISENMDKDKFYIANIFGKENESKIAENLQF